MQSDAAGLRSDCKRRARYFGKRSRDKIDGVCGEAASLRGNVKKSPGRIRHRRKGLLRRRERRPRNLRQRPAGRINAVGKNLEGIIIRHVKEPSRRLHCRYTNLNSAAHCERRTWNGG